MNLCGFRFPRGFNPFYIGSKGLKPLGVMSQTTRNHNEPTGNCVQFPVFII